MADGYTITMTSTDWGSRETTLVIERTSGTDCIELYAEYKIIHPFSPLGCNTFRLSADPKNDYVNGVYVPCELNVHSRQVPSEVQLFNFVFDDPVDLATKYFDCRLVAGGTSTRRLWTLANVTTSIQEVTGPVTVTSKEETLTNGDNHVVGALVYTDTSPHATLAFRWYDNASGGIPSLDYPVVHDFSRVQNGGQSEGTEFQMVEGSADHSLTLEGNTAAVEIDDTESEVESKLLAAFNSAVNVFGKQAGGGLYICEFTAEPYFGTNVDTMTSTATVTTLYTGHPT